MPLLLLPKPEKLEVLAGCERGSLPEDGDRLRPLTAGSLPNADVSASRLRKGEKPFLCALPGAS